MKKSPIATYIFTKHRRHTETFYVEIKVFYRNGRYRIQYYAEDRDCYPYPPFNNVPPYQFTSKLFTIDDEECQRCMTKIKKYGSDEWCPDLHKPLHLLILDELYMHQLC